MYLVLNLLSLLIWQSAIIPVSYTHLQVEYHEDYTNYDTSYLRNYIRHIDLKNYNEKELLAYDKKPNESYLKKQEYLKQMMEVYKQQHFVNLNQIKQDDLEYVLYEMLKKEIYPPYISQSLIQEIKKQTQSTKPNIEITLPVNFVFTKVYNNIAVRKKESDDTYSIKYKSFYKDQQKYFLLSDTGHIHDLSLIHI